MVTARLLPGGTSDSSDGRLTGRRAAPVWLMALTAIVLAGSLALAPDFPIFLIPLILAVAGSFAIVGALMVTRLPGNAVGWILWMVATCIGVAFAGTTYSGTSVAAYGGSLPGTVPIAVFSQMTLVPMLGIVAVFLPLLFPDGHLPSPAWRGFARVSAALIAFATVVEVTMPGSTLSGTGIVNPLGITALAGMTDVLSLVLGAALLIPCALAIASVRVRYRRAGLIARQQLKWFGWAGLALLGSIALGFSNVGPLVESGWLLIVAGLAFLPIAIGIAIFRYRLYDIDRIVSRAIGYLIVTGVLAAVFVGAVLAFSAFLAPVLGENPVAVAASTLVVAALFQPLRARVQRVVDRRFDRSRYDARLAAEAFADRLRDQVALDRIETDLIAAVDATLRPLAVGFWLTGDRRAGKSR